METPATTETEFRLSPKRPQLIGVVHLQPLPGSPRFAGSITHVIDAALADVDALCNGGAHAIIVENFGDAPFRPDRVDPETIACLTRAILEVKQHTSLPLGVNVLRNDALAAVGIAAATLLDFVRVNIHTGVMATDQGIITGQADQTLRKRASLAPSTQIWADVLVKHASPLGEIRLEDAIEDTVLRGLADAIILSGAATGRDTDVHDLERAKAATSVPVLIGSGVRLETVSDFLPGASGLIVGTALKRDGQVQNPVDVNRVRAMREAIDAVIDGR